MYSYEFSIYIYIMYLYIIPNAFIPQYSFCILNCIVTHVSIRHVYITVFWNITVYWKCWCLLCVIIFHDVLLHLPAFSTYNLYIILSFIFCFCRYDKHAIWILYIYISHTHTHIYIYIHMHIHIHAMPRLKHSLAGKSRPTFRRGPRSASETSRWRSFCSTRVGEPSGGTVEPGDRVTGWPEIP